VTNRAIILTGFDPAIHTGGIEIYTNALIDLLRQLKFMVDVHYADQYRNNLGLRHEWCGKLYEMGQALSRQDERTARVAILNGYYGGGYRPKRIPTCTIFHSTHAGYAEAIRGLVPRSTYLTIRYMVGEMMERSAALGAKVIAVSEEVRDELRKWYGLKDVVVIPNPVDTHFFQRLADRSALRERLDIPSEAFVGLYAGRWELAKGRDVVERLIKDIPDMWWLLALATGGDGPLPEGPQIKICKEADRQRMREFYSLADFMIFPSRYEGFGLSPAEAMSCGLPVVGTPVGFLRSVYLQKEFASLCLPLTGKAGDGSVIGKAKEIIHSFVKGEMRWQRLSSEGRLFVQRVCGLDLWNREMRATISSLA
jgi:glycosyltransferase involved in cell wall biosynthesis